MDGMPKQMSLPGLVAAVPPFKPDVVRSRGAGPRRYTLLLAIFPKSEDAHRLARFATGLRDQHGLDGTALSPERLHITLHAVAGFIDVIPQDVVDAAIAASASVACPQIPITFDRALSFPDSDAFVLLCDPHSDRALTRLRQSLALALRRAGLDPQPSRTPHMSLLYDTRHITEHAIEPVCWTATRFALILSHVGVGHHQWIAQWTLTTGP